MQQKNDLIRALGERVIIPRPFFEPRVREGMGLCEGGQAHFRSFPTETPA